MEEREGPGVGCHLSGHFGAIINNLATREAGLVAEEAEKKKRTKYAHLEESHYFVPVAVETLGVFGPEARSFLQDLGRRIANATQDPLSHLYLRQRISVAVQRGNAAAILGPTVGSGVFFVPLAI